MQMLNPLISLVLQTAGVGMKVNARALKQFEIMLTTFAEEGAENTVGVTLHHELAFESMPSLFAGVKPPLPLLGALNWRFGDIHHHLLRTTKPSP